MTKEYAREFILGIFKAHIEDKTELKWVDSTHKRPYVHRVE
jgi:hypothetical protein